MWRHTNNGEFFINNFNKKVQRDEILCAFLCLCFKIISDRFYSLLTSSPAYTQKPPLAKPLRTTTHYSWKPLRDWRIETLYETTIHMKKNLYHLLFALLCVVEVNAQNVLMTDPPSAPDLFQQADTMVNMIAYNGETIDEIIPESSQVPPTTTPIATDRPDQTECPFLVPPKMFQIETGASVEYDKDPSTSSKIKNYTYNTTLLKYGISRQWEFRFIAEYLGTKITSRTDRTLNRNVSGMNSIAVGTKIFICEERGIIPKVALLAHLELPYFGSSQFKVKHLAPRFRFSMQNTLSERFTLSYNVGGEWDGDSQNATIIYTASLGISLVRNLNMFIEAYGFMTENSNVENEFSGSFTNDHRADAGFTYLIKNNLQLDVSGGIGISKVSPDSFLSCGLSWRFPQ